MGVKIRPYRSTSFGIPASHFCGSKPELRWKEAQLRHSLPRLVEVSDLRSKIVDCAVFDGQRQKERAMTGEVIVKAWEPLEEAPAPCASATPLAEGAEAPVAGLSCPKVSLWAVGCFHLNLEAQERRAVPDRFGDVQRLGIHREMARDRGVVAPVLAVSVEDA